MNQQIVCRRRAEETLFPFLKERGVRKFLLVCDAAFPHLRMAGPIASGPVPCAVFQGFSSNPKYEDVLRGVEAFRAEDCDAVVAVGGGSSLDVGKCIKLFARMDPEQDCLAQPLQENGVPLAAVPTTAGTGSESTHFAVVYVNGKKRSVASTAALPDLAILDADALDTLPLYQKKCTLLDALCQGIESAWSVRSTPESRAVALRAVRLVLTAMDGSLHNQREANEDMLRAANLAGQAINQTQTTAGHAMSYKLTSLFGIPHGRAVAVCLPHVLQCALNHPERCVDARGWVHVRGVLADVAREMGCAGPAELPRRLWGLQAALFRGERSEGFRMDALDVLARSVNPERLSNNPVALEEETLRALCARILAGQPPRSC